MIRSLFEIMACNKKSKYKKKLHVIYAIINLKSVNYGAFTCKFM